MYDTGYERANRSLYAAMAASSLADPTNPGFNQLNMGIYGEGGFTLENVCNLSIGYFWPWGFDTNGELVEIDTDRLSITFNLEKGVIPVVNLFGSVTYERTNFVSTLEGVFAGDEEFNVLFDANTVVKAQIAYAVAPSLDVVLLYTTTARRDSNGNLVYATPTSLLPEMNTTLAIETSVHF
jgi:hypothetical protein